MRLTLPVPFTALNSPVWKRLLEAADTLNFKRDADLRLGGVRIIMQSADGKEWTLGVSNGGALTTNGTMHFELTSPDGSTAPITLDDKGNVILGPMTSADGTKTSQAALGLLDQNGGIWPISVSVDYAGDGVMSFGGAALGLTAADGTVWPLTVDDDGTLFVGRNQIGGTVLTSPNGTRFNVTVDDSGNLSTAAL
jgi:hypothetical protein